MIQLHANGSGEIIQIGTDILNKIYPQVLVRGNTWQGCRLKDGGQFALMGTTMSPGFEFEDYRHGDKAELLNIINTNSNSIDALLTKNKKAFFMSPSIRRALLSSIYGDNIPDAARSKMWEDIVMM